MTGCGSAWLERLVWDQEVAGSNPVTPIHNMREWLSWWSATLPRSRPRVRVPSRAFFMQRDIRLDISFFCVWEAAVFSICCMQYFLSYYFMNCVFFAILLRIRV